MRKLKMMEHISLDGVIQHSADDGDFPYGDWTAPYRSPAGRDAILGAHGASFDLLLGRRTYEIWSGYWPKAPSSPTADALNAATKYVATHRPKSLAWGPFEDLGPDIVEGIRRIKSQDGSDLILWGSSTLTPPLLEHGHADEVLLIVYPVLLGTGKRLFAEGTPPRSFELVGAKALPSGPTRSPALCRPDSSPPPRKTGKRPGKKIQHPPSRCHGFREPAHRQNSSHDEYHHPALWEKGSDSSFEKVHSNLCFMVARPARWPTSQSFRRSTNTCQA